MEAVSAANWLFAGVKSPYTVYGWQLFTIRASSAKTAVSASSGIALPRDEACSRAQVLNCCTLIGIWISFVAFRCSAILSGGQDTTILPVYNVSHVRLNRLRVITKRTWTHSCAFTKTMRFAAPIDNATGATARSTKPKIAPVAEPCKSCLSSLGKQKS